MTSEIARRAGITRTVMAVGRTSDYLSPFKILVVEPNPLMRRVTRNLLQLAGGRRIFECTDSETAKSYLKQGDIDFMLSEWYLYTSAGLELVSWVRASKTDIRYTPVIMVTSQTRVENVMKARNLGITEFVAKPFSANSLIMRIKEVVERPRPFVSTRKYFGPDRRRRAKPAVDASERRKNESVLVGGRGLTQDQIDNLVAGDSIRA